MPPSLEQPPYFTNPYFLWKSEPPLFGKISKMQPSLLPHNEFQLWKLTHNDGKQYITANKYKIF